MDENTRYSTPVMFSALSGLLFFGFFLQLSVKKISEGWTEQEQDFVLSRCKVGKFATVLLGFFFLLIGAESWFDFLFFSFIAELVGYLLLVIIAIGIILIAFEIPFQITTITQTASQQKHMLLAFLPVWSEYQRFSTKQFEKPYRWNKEAQLWSLALWLSLVLFSSWMPALILFFLFIFRIVLLFFGKDIITQNQKIGLHRLFRIYPEEAFSFLIISFQKLFGKSIAVENSPLHIIYQKSYQEKQSFIIKLFHFLFWGLLLGFLVFQVIRLALWRKLIPAVWFVMRLCIFIFTKNPLPKLPIIAELTSQK